MPLKPTSYEAAKLVAARYAENRKAKLAAKPAKVLEFRPNSLSKGRKPMKRGTKQLRAKPDPKMAAWKLAVLERDECKCQWPGLSYEDVLLIPAGTIIDPRFIVSPCSTGDTRIDAHHIAERSLRPDLKYDVANGIALCRSHHYWLPLNRAIAVKLGLLSDATYEAAMKHPQN
jgi:hypothetical protein